MLLTEFERKTVLIVLREKRAQLASLIESLREESSQIDPQISIEHATLDVAIHKIWIGGE